jgi:hypothetical protein
MMPEIRCRLQNILWFHHKSCELLQARRNVVAELNTVVPVTLLGAWS